MLQVCGKDSDKQNVEFRCNLAIWPDLTPSVSWAFALQSADPTRNGQSKIVRKNKNIQFRWPNQRKTPWWEQKNVGGHVFQNVFFHDFFWKLQNKSRATQPSTESAEGIKPGTTPATTPTTTSKRTHVQLRVLLAEWNINVCWNTQASGDTLHVFSLALGFETPYHQKLCCTYEQAGPAHRLISAKTKFKIC